MPANLNYAALRISYSAIGPELILAIACVLILAFGAFVKPRKGNAAYWLFGPVTLSLVGMAVSLGFLLKSAVTTGTFFAGSFTQDGYAVLFKTIFLISGMMVVLLSVDYSRRMRNVGEFYGLLVATTAAMCFMASASDLVTLYIAFEFLSLTSYVLAGYLKHEPRSNEAAMKYFLYGSACSAAMLYGMSLLYGIAGSTAYTDIATCLHAGGGENIVLLATSLMLVGMGFKIAMVPFHQWSPDTYEGAPTPVTAFLSVAPKAAGFAVLVRFLTGVVPSMMTHWPGIIGIGAAASMTLGNLAAIHQASAKRMLAYSSIAQAGYVLIGLAAWMEHSEWAVPGIMIYLLTYLFMNLGAFAVVIAIENRTDSDVIETYSGMWKRAPWLAGMMSIFMLSLAGIPPTAGFAGKFVIFGAAIDAAAGKHWLAWLAVLGIVNSVISLYYYLNVVRVMFFVPTKEETPIPVTASIRVALAVALIATLALLVFFGPAFGWATAAKALALH